MNVSLDTAYSAAEVAQFVQCLGRLLTRPSVLALGHTHPMTYPIY
jgi:hypothetical protein